MSKKDELIERLENLKWVWNQKLAVSSFFVYNAKGDAYLDLRSDGLYLCQEGSYRLDIISDWATSSYQKLCYNVRLKILEEVLDKNAIDPSLPTGIG